MKKLTKILVGTSALGTMLPAFAGPDWQTIEHARESKRAQVAQVEKLTPEEKCAAKRLALPLDHGPRAQSTPHLNERRRQSFEAELKACKEAAAKGIAQ